MEKVKLKEMLSGNKGQRFNMTLTLGEMFSGNNGRRFNLISPQASFRRKIEKRNFTLGKMFSGIMEAETDRTLRR